MSGIWFGQLSVGAVAQEGNLCHGHGSWDCFVYDYIYIYIQMYEISFLIQDYVCLSIGPYGSWDFQGLVQGCRGSGLRG